MRPALLLLGLHAGDLGRVGERSGEGDVLPPSALHLVSYDRVVRVEKMGVGVNTVCIDVVATICFVAAVITINSDLHFSNSGNNIHWQLGVECHRQSVSPGRDNLLAWYESPGSRRTILFDVHQDTVPTDGMTISPFEPMIAGGPPVRPRLVRREGEHGRDALGVRPAGARAAGGLRICAPGLHSGRGIHPHRLLPPGRHPAMGPSWRSSPSRPCSTWSTVTRGRCGGRSGPEGSPAIARRRITGVNAIYRMGRVLQALESYAGDARPIVAAPDPRAAEPVGRSDRGGPERQHRPRLVRDRGRPPTHPRRGRRRGASRTVKVLLSRLPGGDRGDRFRSALGAHAGPAPRAGRWLEPLADADRHGHRPTARGPRASPSAPTPGP